MLGYPTAIPKDPANPSYAGSFKILLRRYQRFKGCDQFRQLLLEDLPDDIQSDAVIVVNQTVAQPDHFSPGDLGVSWRYSNDILLAASPIISNARTIAC